MSALATVEFVADSELSYALNDTSDAQFSAVVDILALAEQRADASTFEVHGRFEPPARRAPPRIALRLVVPSLRRRRILNARLQGPRAVMTGTGSHSAVLYVSVATLRLWAVALAGRQILIQV